MNGVATQGSGVRMLEIFVVIDDGRVAMCRPAKLHVHSRHSNVHFSFSGVSLQLRLQHLTKANHIEYLTHGHDRAIVLSKEGEPRQTYLLTYFLHRMDAESYATRRTYEHRKSTRTPTRHSA